MSVPHLQHLPFLLVHFTFSHDVNSALFLLCHKGASVHLPPPPPTDRWVTSFFFLTGRGPLHEMAFSAFSRSLLGRTNTFSSQFLLTPRISLNALPLPLLILTLFLLPFPLLLLCTRQNFSMDKASSWFPPISFRALYRLRYLTLFQLALSLLSPIRRYFVMSIFLKSLLVLSRRIPNSALNAVSLVPF